MNTIGKILVIFNLIFALLTGGFLVFDFATRQNWKTAHDELKRELTVAQSHYNVSGKTANVFNDQIKKLKNDFESEKVKHIETKTLLEAQLNEERQNKTDAEQRARFAEQNLKKSVDDNKRLQTEVVLSLDNLKKAEERVALLENQLQKANTLVIQRSNEAEQTQARNENLLTMNRELQRKLAELANPTKADGVAVARGPFGSNPPPVRVQGQVLKVDPEDRTLVTLSLGSDNGVQKNHTLEVYRFNPQPEYVGMVRILDSYHKQSIGKMITPSGQRQMKVGDVVADSILP